MNNQTKAIMLIIPDVHGRTFWRSATKKYPNLPTIFLGDYLDPYTHLDGILPADAFAEFQKILKFKKENEDRVTLLLGNHDVHYFTPRLSCSRKDWQNEATIAQLFINNLQYFKLCKTINVGDMQILFSHAGIIPGWLNKHFQDLDVNDIKQIEIILNSKLQFEDLFVKFINDSLMDVPISRWGDALYGSMVWADMEDHISSNNRLRDVYQVFGHTQQKSEPVITEHFANLDCRKAFLLLDDGTLVKA